MWQRKLRHWRIIHHREKEKRRRRREKNNEKKSKVKEREFWSAIVCALSNIYIYTYRERERYAPHIYKKIQQHVNDIPKPRSFISFVRTFVRSLRYIVYYNGHKHETFMAVPIGEMKNYRKRPLKRRSSDKRKKSSRHICKIGLLWCCSNDLR